jgi:hypothetical protein
MSDEFFRKTFGDSESVHLGSGWVSASARYSSDYWEWARCCACAFPRC